MELLGIFVNVLAPVFALAALGYFAGPRLKLEARTLTRLAYFVLIPAFTFDVLSTARIEPQLALRMTVYAALTHLACAALGFGVARLLGRPAPMVAAYTMSAVFGNVGNFGLPIIQFRFPDEAAALEISTVYFLAISTLAFMVSVAAVNWEKNGGWRAALAVVQTPALLAVPPALLVNALGLALPPILTRPLELLAAAMIPTMLIALGVQLTGAGLPRFNADVWLASAVRLLGGPALAALLALPFGLSGLERSIGIIQAAMPTAVLASIIALENDTLPSFVITTVLVSTLASLATLTLVLALV
jgi:predicted permease